MLLSAALRCRPVAAVPSASPSVAARSVAHNPGATRPMRLELADGTVLHGKSFGAEKSDNAECVFQTGMVGYPESMTDPSYAGQFLTMTYPLIGTYGVPGKELDEIGLLRYFESRRIWISGLIVQQYQPDHSHWNAKQSLADWLKDEGIIGLTGIDTRALTQRIRDHGSMPARIILDGDHKAEQSLPMGNPVLERNLVAEVSRKAPEVYGKGNRRKVIAVDCGIKNNIIRRLVFHGAEVKVVPWDYDFNADNSWDGLFLSNGPGNPEAADVTIRNLSKAIKGDRPIFGICLGHQLMCLAAGGRTYKLRFGNRGQNIPCRHEGTPNLYITPQNHGFAVDMESMGPSWKPMFTNVNDLTSEGMHHATKDIYTVQFHPEARGGPLDTDFLFTKFMDNIDKYLKKSGKK